MSFKHASRYLCGLITLLVLATSCSNSGKRQAKNLDTKLQTPILRFDQAFWNFDTSNPEASMNALLKDYPDITPIYLERVVKFGDPLDTLTWQIIAHFHNDTSVQDIYNATLKEYDDLTTLSKTLTKGFQRMHALLPQIPIPKCYAHISGFNQNIIASTGFMSVSLDDYMGADFIYYDKADIHKYQRYNMRREKLVPDMILGWISSEYTLGNINANLLSAMLHKGRLLYATSCLLPQEPDSILLGYTAEQITWAETYEQKVWKQLVGSGSLFKNDYITKTHYLNEAPFTSGVSQDSPPRLGEYIGYKIVCSYMKHNSKISLQELLETQKFKEILEESYYKP